MQGVGMFMWRQLSRWGTIVGLFLACSAEAQYTLKNVLQISGKRGILKFREKRD